MNLREKLEIVCFLIFSYLYFLSCAISVTHSVTVLKDERVSPSWLLTHSPHDVYTWCSLCQNVLLLKHQTLPRSRDFIQEQLSRQLSPFTCLFPAVMRIVSLRHTDLYFFSFTSTQNNCFSISLVECNFLYLVFLFLMVFKFSFSSNICVINTSRHRTDQTLFNPLLFT